MKMRNREPRNAKWKGKKKNTVIDLAGNDFLNDWLYVPGKDRVAEKLWRKIAFVP